MSSEKDDFETFLQRELPHAKLTRIGHGLDISAGSGEACDFCASIFAKGTALRVYGANDVWIGPHTPGVPPYKSVGDWGACDPCAACIDANDRAGLLERALTLSVQKYGKLGRLQARELIRAAHDAFFRART
jgi:hypothetical protein